MVDDLLSQGYHLFIGRERAWSSLRLLVSIQVYFDEGVRLISML
jgi:hypothetical protein